jgi:alpha-galactosidase
MKRTAGWFCTVALLVAGLAVSIETAIAEGGKNISGNWVGMVAGPQGQMEVSYKLNVVDGKITGIQTLPFRDARIVDGQVTNDTFHFTVVLERFGRTENREVTGKIVGDTLVLVPALSGPPPPEGAPAGTPLPAPPPMAPATFHRGTPTPNYRAPLVDYATLPKVELPAIQPVSDNGLAKTPPMGWNSWNKFQTRIDDKMVRAIADAAVSSGMKDAGYIYINIDDGWQGTRDASGVIQPNPNFPDMKALADYVHSKGLKLGIYSGPGPRTCAGYEGSYGHEEQDARTYAAWGIDYLKYDWCSASHVWQDSDMRAAYQKMGTALESAGRPIVYSLCQYGRASVQEWGPLVGGNLWRTTGDIRDRYDSMAKIGFAQTDLAKYAGPGHWNDPDMLEVGNGGMTNDEYRTHFSLWAMIAAPLIAGNDLRVANPEIAGILLNKEVIAIDQDPLGKGGTRVAKDGDIEVWAKPLASGDYAVAIFNRGTAEAHGKAEWKDLGWSGKHQVRDLWAHTDRGAIADSFSATVPAHGVVMVHVAK